MHGGLVGLASVCCAAHQRIWFVPGELSGHCRSTALQSRSFSHRPTDTNLLTDDLLLNKSSAGNSDRVCSEDTLFIVCVISGARRYCYYLSTTACRCGWELTSIGCLMTVLFVWWVSPRKAVMWQEIAVEEGWASCWAGAARCCPALSFSPTLSPCLSGFIP